MSYSEPPYFPLYVRDFYSSGKVAAMSPTAVGAYILLLCQAWGEKPPASVPNDDTVLAAWARMDSVAWTEHKSVVLAAFKLGKDNRWYQPRLREEYNKFKKLSQQRSKSGKIGGKNHWRKVREDKELNSTAIAPLIANDSIAVAVSVKDLKSVCDARAYPPYHSQSGQDLHRDALAILHEVNERCNKHFPDHYAAGLAVIKDRLLEGREPHEFARIIEVKLHDPLFQKKPNLYDPITLFSADKFDVYLHQDPEGWSSNKGKPTPKPEPEPMKPPMVRRTVNPDPELVAWFRRTVVDPMRDEVNEHAWKAFIEPLVPVSKNGDGLVLYADRNVRQWVEEHRLSQIAALAGCGVRIIDDEDE